MTFTLAVALNAALDLGIVLALAAVTLSPWRLDRPRRGAPVLPRLEREDAVRLAA